VNAAHFWQGWKRSLSLLAASTALFTSGATLPSKSSVAVESLPLADLTIQVPIGLPDYPIIIVPRRPAEPQRSVTVRFVAQGDEWATIYLDDRQLFRAANTRRDYAVELSPGAYRLQITGVSRFDVWDSGYLDVGRDDSNLIVIRYSEAQGIRVAGDPYAWIPD